MNRTSNVPKNENGLILMGVRGRGGGKEGWFSQWAFARARP